MTANRVGGDESNYRYFALYLVAVFVGSLIRVVAFLFPARVVRKLEHTLVGDRK